MSDPERPRARGGPRTREDYERGLPDHHDPTAGYGGAPPARSALTLRLVLAVFGLLACAGGGTGLLIAGVPLWFPVLLFVLAAIALVNVAVVARRKLRGEPG